MIICCYVRYVCLYVCVWVGDDVRGWLMWRRGLSKGRRIGAVFKLMVVDGWLSEDSVALLKSASAAYRVSEQRF